MSAEKRINVVSDGEFMTITTSRSLGLFLAHPGVKELVGRLGSVLRKNPDFDVWNVVPPIGKEHLEVFGQALIELAKTIDPDGAAPDFKSNED